MADPTERLYWRAIVGVTIAGAALRIAVLVSKWDQPLLLNDSLWYAGEAHSLAHGRFFPQLFDVSGAEHGPLTPIVLAPVSLLPHHEFWQRAMMTLIGIGLAPLIAVLGRRVGGRRVAVIAAAMAAVYPNIWMGDALIMSETLSLFLIVATLIAAMHFRDRMDFRSAVLLGVLVGIAAHARSEILIFAPLFALIGVRNQPWRQWLGRAAAVVGATVLTVLPWITFNLSRFEAPVLMSTNEGATWLGANCPATYGGEALGGWLLTCIGDNVARPDEDASQKSARQRSEALRYATHHRGRLPVVVGARLLRTLDLYRLDELVDSDAGEERARWSVWLGVVCWWILAPLAAIGLWRERRRTGIVLLAPVICVIVTSVVFYGSHRLRAPVEPVIVLGAAMFLTSLAPIRAWTPDRFSREAGSSPAS